MKEHPKIRLARAIAERRRTIEEYGNALRARVDGIILSDLARRCQNSDAELTAALQPFMAT